MQRFRVVVVWRPLERPSERFRTWTEYLATSAGSAEIWAAGAFAARGRIVDDVTALAIQQCVPDLAPTEPRGAAF